MKGGTSVTWRSVFLIILWMLHMICNAQDAQLSTAESLSADLQSESSDCSSSFSESSSCTKNGAYNLHQCKNSSISLSNAVPNHYVRTPPSDNTCISTTTDCVWSITSDPGSAIYVGFLFISRSVNLSYSFVVGEGVEHTNSSSERFTLNFKVGDGCDDGREYFVGSNLAWVRMSVNTWPPEFNDCIVVSLKFTQKAGPGLCNSGTSELCNGPPACLPYSAKCDGRVDCDDFSDQVDCHYCGPTDVSLTTGIPVTLHFPFNVDDAGQIGTTTDCIWNVTAPENNIIEINIVATAKYGPDIYVKSNAGGDYDESLIVLKSNTFDILYSNTSAVRIYADAITVIYFKISLTAYMEKVCNATDFQCQNQQCVNKTSVCDGIHDCPVLEDEYGCGDNCSTNDSYMCPADQSCINSSLVCDGKGHCPGFTDELDCGRCGDPYTELSSQPARIVQPVGVTVDCIWIVSTSSSHQFPRIILEILQLKIVYIYESIPIWQVYLASVTLGTGSIPFNEGSVVRRLTRTEAYPHVLTFDGPSIWIIVDVDNNPTIRLQGLPSIELTIKQEAPTNCTESHYACSSGLSCIHRDRLCDGQVDCPEFDDEIGCAPCDGNQFKCTRSNGCLDPALLCDGEAQCPDSSDEGKCAPCGDNYVDVSSSPQTLTSPLYPNDYYPDNIHCEWFVHGAPGYEIVVVILYFSIERDFDYLLVESNSSIAVRLTGWSHFQRISLYTQDVKLILVTDYVVNYPGFSLRLVQMQNASCGDLQVPCNGTTHLVCILETLVCNNEGDCPGATDEDYCPDFCGETKISLGVGQHNITSPKYPSPYPLHIFCMWEISADEKDVAIKLEIQYFDLEFGYDFLEVRDMNQSEHKSTVHLTGTTKISTILYRSRFISMYFYSDEYIATSGFLITLQTIDQDYTLFKTCPNLYKCPATENQVDFCLQKDALCDGFGDCPDSRDELRCGTVDCDENEYQCGGDQQCLMWGSVCNGIPNCELFHDDETDCATQGCPEHCACFFGDKGLHVKCNGWTLATVNKLVVITGVLDLIGGNITTLGEGNFKRLVNLKTLSLRNNSISRLELNTFAGLGNLTSLDISENHFTSLPGGLFQQQVMLTELGLRSVPIRLIEENAFQGLKSLKKLVLMHGDGSIGDTHETAIEVEDGALTDLLALQTVYVDDYKLCCDFAAVLNHSKDCVTTQLQSPLFNCGRLMPNVVLQGFMWILGFSALIGNAVVIAWRIREDSGKGSKFVHSFLVLNLAFSDFFMGVYMIIIATVDEIKKEGYYLEATQWRNSALCKAAGIISVLSSEASVFFITLISIDRYMCIVHPFSRVRLRERSVVFTAGFIWIMTLGLSVIPTVLITKDSHIYGLSDVCIGLPLLTTPSGYSFKEQDFGDQLSNDTYLIPVPEGSKPSWSYSIVLFLGVNLSCFLAVTYCYIAIFAKVKRSIRRVKQGSHKEEEIKMASKMAIIVGSDFLCWMPVIVLGILSQTSVIKIEPEMYAWLVVLVLPINSSLNPYLYTIVTVISRRRQSLQASSRRSSNAKHGVTNVALGGKNNLITLTTKTGTLSTSMYL